MKLPSLRQSQRLFYSENDKEMLIQEFTSNAENLIE